jgi:hypothetical protein
MDQGILPHRIHRVPVLRRDHPEFPDNGKQESDRPIALPGIIYSAKTRKGFRKGRQSGERKARELRCPGDQNPPPVPTRLRPRRP